MAWQRLSFLTLSSYGVRADNHILPASSTMIMNCSSSLTSNEEDLFKAAQKSVSPLQAVSSPSHSHLQLPSEILIQDNRLEFGQFVAHEAIFDEEYWTAAWLRAESHWEEQHQDRYVDSYKRKYAEQEFNALKRRCKAQLGQKCTCVVVTAKEEVGNVLKSVVGTLDLVIGQLLPGETFPGEMVLKAPTLSKINSKASRYGYISNLCVSKSARRQGIASNMLHFAIRNAKSYGADSVFVHVHRNNKSAQKLYQKVGFQIVEETNEQLHLLCIKA